MAREPVAVDYMGVGGVVRGAEGSEERVRLVRPIPSVPDNRGGHSHSRRSPALEGGRDSSPFMHHGLRQQLWNRPLGAARFQSEEDKPRKAIVSPKQEKESTDGPLNAHHQPLPQWDNSNPASPSHPSVGSSARFDEFHRMQQARKIAAMHASQQMSRGMQNAGARTSQFRDEAQRDAQPSDRSSSEHLATQPHPPSNQGAFGSPTPIFHGMMKPDVVENGAAMAAKRPPLQQHIFQGNHALPSHGLARPGGPGKQPRTAQLTIFYAGMVNVYDDVPFDKAQAIMLLAGSGNPWSSNFMNPPAIGATGRPFSAPSAVPLQSTPSTPGSPAPQVPTTSAAGTPRPMLPGVVHSNVRQPPITNVELPQARKASLARFLEKRKDRVRKVPVKEEGDASPSRGNSPGPSTSKPPTRSPSPSPSAARSMDPGLSPGRPEHQLGASSCSDRNSPQPSRPPQTPPRQSASDEKSAGTPKRKDSEFEQASSKRARSGRSPWRLAGKNAADHAKEENDSSHR